MTVSRKYRQATHLLAVDCAVFGQVFVLAAGPAEEDHHRLALGRLSLCTAF